MTEERAGRIALATRLFAAAAAAAPTDALLLNSVGSFFARQGDHRQAEKWFDRAIAVDPAFAEAILNRAIAKDSLGQSMAALKDLAARERELGSTSRYWSIRGSIARTAHDLAQAAACYDRCLAIEPDHRRAMSGRARIALERDEADAVARFDRALRVARADPYLWLGKAQALDASGNSCDALAMAESLVDQMPLWTDALEFLAQLRWGLKDHFDFTSHYVAATNKDPDDPALALSWARMLRGAQQTQRAAEILEAAAARLPHSRELMIADAVHAGEAGDHERADRLFTRFTPRTADEWAQLARHLIRIGRIEEAENTLAIAITLAPHHTGAWALRDLVWRLRADHRGDWLHGQPGLIAEFELELSAGDLADAVAALDAVHDLSMAPIGQSVRRGTQTRGGLFDRLESALTPLSTAIDAAVAIYKTGLPAHDLRHPLLSRRDERWRVAKSWSVRLTSGGWHAEHIHPEGIVSSAAYLVVPPKSDDPLAGALELGRPPADLQVDLPPRATIQPRAGYLALFPSSLFHGTRHFADGRRMSVAFDIDTF